MTPSLLWPERVSSLAVSDLAALTAAVAVADDERMLVEVRGEGQGQGGGQGHWNANEIPDGDGGDDGDGDGDFPIFTFITNLIRHPSQKS